MDPIETAIRNAFDEGDPEDRAFREGVYRKAFSALDRALQANPELTVEAAIRRRRILQQKITEIESEFIPAVEAPAADAALEDDPLAGAFEVRMEPGPAPDPIDLAPVAEHDPPPVDADLGRLDIGAERRMPGRNGARPTSRDPLKPARRKRPFVVAFFAVTVIAMLGVGALFAWQTGLFLSPAERDTSVPNPPSADSEDFIPENEEPPVLSSDPGPQRDWIGIFKAPDAAAVAAPSDTTAEAMQDESGAFLRIRSGSSGAAVVFDVGQGILEKIAGRKATFDVVARAADGKSTEMAIDCNFGELGDCSRKRYAVGYDSADFLFEVTLPAGQPGSGGTITVNSDFSGGGKSVDIYEIKVSLSP